ncbi:MAG: YegP family protein [Erysipelotrichaceae bacterium]
MLSTLRFNVDPLMYPESFSIPSPPFCVLPTDNMKTLISLGCTVELVTNWRGGEIMYFVIHKASNGQFYFVIKSGNGQTVATSEMYVAKDSAKKTIDSIKEGVNSKNSVIDMTV